MIEQYNVSLNRPITWATNIAPHIQSLIQQKTDWYGIYQDQFWEDFYTNIFNLDTCGVFGIQIWSIILGVPSKLFGLYPITNAWAFGIYRENFAGTGISDFVMNEWNTVVNDEQPVPTPSAELNIGGNFYGGGDTTIIDLNEVKYVLKLRYLTLVCNNRPQFINRMLRYIFNGGEPWDYSTGQYFYVADNTLYDTANPITKSNYIEYRIGSYFDFSDQFVNLLNTKEYGIIPKIAGSQYLVVRES